NKFLFYYDLSEKAFTINKQPESDVFSKRFDTYLVFIPDIHFLKFSHHLFGESTNSFPIRRKK
ncbi:MAG: hypothetical protein QQN63_04205, partial [Nitrosopumilus sp.]